MNSNQKQLTFDEARELCNQLLEVYPNSGFGPGHIVLSDYNFEPHHLMFSLLRIDAEMTHINEKRVTLVKDEAELKAVRRLLIAFLVRGVEDPDEEDL